MASKDFNDIYEKVSPESKVFTSMSFDIIDQINFILNKKGISKKELAKKLGKPKTEVNKWLSPGYNLTLRTLAKITVALEETIIETAA